MKKLISLSLVLIILLGILAVPAAADESQITVGSLAYLTITEEQDQSLGASARRPLTMLLYLRGILSDDGEDMPDSPLLHRHYDSLNALLMALMAGEVNAIYLPYYTARYLCATNEGLKPAVEYHPEKASGLSAWALSLLCDGYAFMLKDDNAALKDAIDAQITAMKEDGTLQQLIDEHIVKASEGGEPVAVAFEQFEGDPVRVAVTGSLPPMDYVAPDGSFAGFNTAVLAEIGRRLQKNIELVQVDSMGRSLALSEGRVDVVFWTRGLSENMTERSTTGEHLQDLMAKAQDAMTEEEKAVFAEFEMPGPEMIAQWTSRDTPSDTIITQPYFSDLAVRVILR